MTVNWSSLACSTDWPVYPAEMAEVILGDQRQDTGDRGWHQERRHREYVKGRSWACPVMESGAHHFRDAEPRLLRCQCGAERQVKAWADTMTRWGQRTEGAA